MLSSLKTFTLALVVTGMEVPHSEDHDDLREEEHEVAFAEAEAEGGTEATVAALEAKIRAQVAAIAATHKEIEALRAQAKDWGFSFITSPSKIGPDGTEGCMTFTLEGMSSSVMSNPPVQIKLWKGGMTNAQTAVTSKTPVASWKITNPQTSSQYAPKLYALFGKNAKWGEGGCPAADNTFEELTTFFETKLSVPWESGEYEKGKGPEGSGDDYAEYCVSLHKLDKDGGFKAAAWSYMSDSIKCFKVGCSDNGNRCNTDLVEGNKVVTFFDCFMNLGMC